MSHRYPWVALDVATDPVEHSRRLRHAHERSLEGDVTHDDVRELVIDSWHRSLAAGVSPTAPGAPLVMQDDELAAARADSPLAPAIDTIFDVLARVDSDAQHVVAIADAHANLLWVKGDLATLERARESMCFAEGASWSETAVGTNAVGTAAALDHEVQIFSAEHLVEAIHDWTCSAAPIRDRMTGELIGVIDLTASLRTAHPHTLSLATFAARAAENKLLYGELRALGRLLERWQAAVAGVRSGSALLDRHGRVIASDSAGPLPPRLDLPADGAGPITLPDGRSGELERLDGAGSILWLWKGRP